jgi:hypothetical protein
MSTIHLITTYYKAKEPERELENNECLHQNIENPNIHQIHLFIQGSDEPKQHNHQKVKIIKHGRRPTFNELFQYANSLNKEDIKIVANSDIYFDITIKKCSEALKKWDVLALTRWDVSPEKQLHFFNNFKSQDTWVFKKNIPQNIGNFFIGQYGCDNRLLHEFVSNGCTVGNPSFSIITHHLHNSGLRNYLLDPNYEYVKEPYGYVLPRYLKSTLQQYLNFNFVSLRYQYHKSRKNNTLLGKNYNIIERAYSLIAMKLFAFLTNRKK